MRMRSVENNRFAQKNSQVENRLNINLHNWQGTSN